MKKTNNKGFSLIELIIVIAIMAVLVAIIAPNLTKYLGSSKEKTDKKNADEIASQIQTCITEYDTEKGILGNTAPTVTWSASGAACDNSDFADIVNQNITSSTQSKVDANKYAKADITYDENTKVYKIHVELGNATSDK